MDNEEVLHAWAAGFIDGEGAVMLTKSNKYGPRYVSGFQVAITMHATQKVRRPLDKLAEMYGGKVTLEKNGRIYYWRIHGKHAVAALRKMRPYLLVKDRHADIVEEYFARCVGQIHVDELRLELFNKMKSIQIKNGNGRNPVTDVEAAIA